MKKCKALVKWRVRAVSRAGCSQENKFIDAQNINSLARGLWDNQGGEMHMQVEK